MHKFKVSVIFIAKNTLFKLHFKVYQNRLLGFGFSHLLAIEAS